jgi:hypothetical protein
MADGALIAFEVVAGQVANAHNTVEQALLRRMGLVPYTIGAPQKTITRKHLPTTNGNGNGSTGVVIAEPLWRKGEVRMIQVPVTVVCIDPKLHIYAIEELTALESLKHSLETILENLKEMARPPQRPDEDE